MIKTFKSKRQLFDELINDTAIIFNNKDKSRFLKIAYGQFDEDCKLFISNLLIKIKFNLIGTCKDLDYCYQKRNKINSLIKKGIILDCNLLNYKKNLDDSINVLKKYKLSLGRILINYVCPLLSMYFTVNEIIELIGASKVEVNEILKTLENIKGDLNKENTIAFDIIYHHGEYRWKKGRSKDFLDCPSWEIPLFSSILECVTEDLRNVSDNFKFKINDEIEGLFEEAMYYSNNGKLEKVLTEITVRELISNYRDTKNSDFISKLKKSTLIDLNQIYLLKKNKNYNYYIIMDRNKSKLGFVCSLL